MKMSNYLSLALLMVAASTDKLIAKNRLNWIEIAIDKSNADGCSPIFTQIMFDFTNQINVNTSFSVEKQQLTINFPGMNKDDLNARETENKLVALKKSGLIGEPIIHDKGSAGTQLVIPFVSNAMAQDNENDKKYLVKWSTIKDPNRLIIDIFCKKSLERVSARNHIILQADSGLIMTDYRPTLPQPPQKRPSETRIMIDAGHGGPDAGTKSACGTQEKDLALALSRKVHKQLKAAGYNVHLTRNQDKAVSLLNRSQLANQLDADLFVSIHLNSSGSNNTAPAGIETYYLDNVGLVPPTHTGGYYFVNTPKDKKLIAAATKLLNKNVDQSHNLASAIQSSIISELNENGFKPRNRGVKKSNKVRIFLRNSSGSIPSALAEVGFLSNPKEAAQLKDQDYQQHIASGICRGIKKYLKNATHG